MARKPVSKNCPHCGRYMEFFWAEVGPGAASWVGCGYTLVPAFYCSFCGEWDNVFIDPEYYEWPALEGTIDFKEARRELTPSQYGGLVADYRWAKEHFLNRPFLAIPGFI